jgi:hypothetical protein
MAYLVIAPLMVGQLLQYGLPNQVTGCLRSAPLLAVLGCQVLRAARSKPARSLSCDHPPLLACTGCAAQEARQHWQRVSSHDPAARLDNVLQHFCC